MTRTEALIEIQATLSTLADDRVELLYDLLQAWSRPTVFDTLPDSERVKIDAALDRLDAGQSIPGETVFANFAAKLTTAL